MRARFHAEPIVKATELLLQERMPRDVAATRPWAAEVKSAAGARDVEPSGGRRFALRSSGDTGDTSALERSLRDDADLRRVGIQPLGRSGGDALARGCDLRRLRLLHLTSRTCAAGVVMVGGLPAQRRRAGRLRGRLQRGSRRDHAPRRLADDDAGCDRSGRRRRGSAPGLDHEFRKSRARPRDHLLRRSSSWRRRAPTLRIRRSPSCSSKRNISPTSAPSWRRGESDRRASRRSGPHI